MSFTESWGCPPPFCMCVLCSDIVQYFTMCWLDALSKALSLQFYMNPADHVNVSWALTIYALQTMPVLE